MVYVFSVDHELELFVQIWVALLSFHHYIMKSLYNECDPNEISLKSHMLSAVLQNHEILDFNYDWSQLLFLEAYYIKKHDPVINHWSQSIKRAFVV